MSAAAALSAGMFRAYDIRGVVGEEVNPTSGRLIGAAYATLLRRSYGVERMVVGRDNRPSSEELRDAFVAGALAAGVSVVDVGVAPSPLGYYAAATWGIDGGAVVTASHSPTHMNGFKLLERGGAPLSPEEIQEVYTLAVASDFEAGTGVVETRDAREEYLAMLAGRFELARPLRVVADPGNGVATLTGPEALRRIGCAVEVMHGESDGTFPSHMPNPQDASTMVELQARVRATGADMGVAWDGDGDRVGFVDETGVRPEADAILAVFAREALRRRPGASILMDVKTSLSAVRDVEAHGGRPVIGRTGHSFGKRAMREGDYAFGGEASGHFFFADNHNFDDGVYGACLMAWILAREPRPLSAVFAGIPQFVSSPEIAMPCPDAAKFGVAAAVGRAFAARYEVSTLDGARITFPDAGEGDGWALVRASNTGPTLSVRFEASNPARFAQIRDAVLAELARHPEVEIPPVARVSPGDAAG